MKARHAMLAALAACRRDGRGRRHHSGLAFVLGLGDGATRFFADRCERRSCLGFSRREADGDGEGNSVLVRRYPRADEAGLLGALGKMQQHLDRQVPGGPISLNKSIVGPQDAEAIIYWTSFPDGDYADPCTRLLGRAVGSIGRRSRGRSVEGARHQAPQGAFGRHPRRAPREARRAQRSQEPAATLGSSTPGETFMLGAFWRTTDVGDTIRVWIVAVDGKRLFIAAATKQGGGLEKEVQQIVQSIRFA